jgi:hypothetical protein
MAHYDHHHQIPDPQPRHRGSDERLTPDAYSLTPQEFARLCDHFLSDLKCSFYTQISTSIGPLFVLYRADGFLCLLSRERDEATFLTEATALLGTPPLREEDEEEHQPVTMLRKVQRLIEQQKPPDLTTITRLCQDWHLAHLRRVLEHG